MPCIIAFKDWPIGEVTAIGKMLCKRTFYHLTRVNRIRAYLLMVWPESRRSSAIGVVCRVNPRDVRSFLKTDIRDGVMIQLARGQWRAAPVHGTTERAGGGDTKGGASWPHSANGA